jgi:hypothetical protein
MCRNLSTLAAVAVIVFAIGIAPARALTDPNVLCHKTVVKELEKYKKTHLKLFRNCLDKENRGDIPGPCLDTVSAIKLDATNVKVAANIAKKCNMGNVAFLGYRADCQYGPATAGIGGTCFALPVTTPTEFAECMKCWKGAEFARLEGTLYASHAQEVCGTALDNTSVTCAAVGCTSPLPVQSDLGGGGDNDCQRMLSKATMNYLLKREHILEKCLLKLGTLPLCLADLKVQLQLSKAETQKDTLIHDKCGNRKPVADPPYCCNTGPAQMCVAAASRDDCVMNLGGSVKEGKTCNAGTCDPVGGGNQSFAWWESCPNNQPCPGPTLGNLDGVVDCVDSLADEAVSTLLCLQFPNGAACPTPIATPTPTPTSTP